ncbi:NnrS family protein [Calidifontimicrobium sp. SYSU G02091]|uniref:NnrS family protein n=1 Tax=Calidifontimicrobium sp. SYSU G02091 TaxID=2926421 RepID=UPI001F53968D|nr:NnrS family protein [Calidifontimicrobium sp. SYSU G02091]MCI1190947.1 NnrS family protein [Calidifontimicrobium sp. SYSU G02091]
MKTIPLRTIPVAPVEPARRARVDPPPWRPQWLFAAPHRLAFFAGALMLAASAVWWLAALVARTAGVDLPWSLPPAAAHGLLMGFGFMPLFFAGFLFTAGPKWLDVPAPSARSLLGAVLAQLAGWTVFALGVHVRDPDLARVLGTLGLAAAALGWSSLAARFVGLLRASRVADAVHARCIAASGVAGAMLLWAAAIALALGAVAWLRPIAVAGLWGFAGVVYVTVAHRMVPFFTAAALPRLDAWRPYWLLAVFVGAMAFEALAAVAQALWWPQPAVAHALQAAVEAAVAALLLGLAVRWGLVQSLKLRLLAMLHLGLVWLGVAFALAAWSNVLVALGGEPLGRAPLHAFTMGFLGSTLLAMATRVSCGHGGRTLAADDLAWALYLLLQAAVLARLGTELLPVGPAGWVVAAGLWAMAVGGWALRYGRWYGRPRVDGRPG